MARNALPAPGGCEAREFPVAPPGLPGAPRRARPRPGARLGLLAGLLLGLFLAGAPAGAGPATDQVRAAVDQVIRILEDPELKKPAHTERRRAQIREVARGLFSFEEMSRRVLGRHWAQRTPEERQRFVELFADLLEATYVSKIERYSGERIVYLGELVDGDTVTVRSRVVLQQGTEVPLDYRLLRQGDRWQVYDVLVEGVSLVANYRSQFNKIIAQSSYQELVRRVEQKSRELREEGGPGRGGARP